MLNVPVGHYIGNTISRWNNHGKCQTNAFGKSLVTK